MHSWTQGPSIALIMDRFGFLKTVVDENPWVFYPSVFVAGLVGYASLCSALRFRRVNGFKAKHGFHDRESLSQMTNEQAHSIVNAAGSKEFPLFYDLALRVALFKTYAIENIAKLLVSSSDLNRQTQAPKRYEDTAIIFSSFIKFPPGSPLLHQAVARMNFLHSPYIKTNKILNHDLLYVLWASMSEPVRFMRLYEWRELDPMEVAAIGQLWKYIGEMMEIDYKAELGKNQWKDGIEFMDDVTEWAMKYEDEAMKPLPESKQLGKVLIDLLLSAYPEAVGPMARSSVLVLMGDRLRHAFSLPEPTIYDCAVTYSLLFWRKTFLRYLALPRITPVEYISDPDAKTGRMHNLHYLKEPWYAPVTFWSRWNPVALVTRATGGLIPGDGGEEMMPQGFLIGDIGPKSKMGKGLDVAKELESRVRDRASTGCPFAV